MVLNQLINGGAEQLGDVVGKPNESANRESFSRDFGEDDFDSFGGDVRTGQFIEIARFRVPSDTEYSWGYGKANNPENQGYIYVNLKNDASSPVELEGTLRLTVESSTGRKTHVVQDLATSKLDASKSDKSKMVPLPEQVGSPLAPEDAYLVVKFQPKSNDTVSKANSDVIMPVTEYDLS